MAILQQFGANLVLRPFPNYRDSRHSIILEGILTWTRVDTFRHRGCGFLDGRKGHQRVWKDR